MSSETDPKVDEVMRLVDHQALTGPEYNRVYGLIRDGFRWRATAEAPSDGRVALGQVREFAEFEAGRTRYNLAPPGSYWEGFDAAMKLVANFCRCRRAPASKEDAT